MPKAKTYYTRDLYKNTKQVPTFDGATPKDKECLFALMRHRQAKADFEIRVGSTCQIMVYIAPQLRSA